MERDEVLAVLRRKAVELLEADSDALQPDRSFVDDLRVDSLSFAEFVMDLEDELGIELTADELTDVATVGGLLDLVMSKVALA